MLKKCYIILVMSLTVIMLTACGHSASQSQENQEAEQVEIYKEAVADLQEISLDQAIDKIANSENFILYLGRPTCDYCNIFVPKLAQAYQDKSVTIYYVDSDKADEQTFNDFTSHFKIKTVPNFSYYADNQQIDSLVKGSESSVEEIKAFIERYGVKD